MTSRAVITGLFVALAGSVLSSDANALGGVMRVQPQLLDICDKDGDTVFSVRPRASYNFDLLKGPRASAQVNLYYELSDIFKEAWDSATRKYDFPDNAPPNHGDGFQKFYGSELKAEADRLIREKLNKLNAERGLNLTYDDTTLLNVRPATGKDCKSPFVS